MYWSGGTIRSNTLAKKRPRACHEKLGRGICAVQAGDGKSLRDIEWGGGRPIWASKRPEGQPEPKKPTCVNTFPFKTTLFRGGPGARKKKREGFVLSPGGGWEEFI